MIKSVLHLLFLLLLLFPLQAENLSFQDLLKLASDRNPKIKAMSEEVAAYQERIAPSTARPDPMLELGIKNMGLKDYNVGDEPNSGLPVYISQTIPRPHKLALQGEISEFQYQQKLQEAKALSLSIERQVKSLIFNLKYLHDSEEILKRQKSQMEKILKITKSRYGVGDILQSDITKAQLEVSKMDELILPLKEMIRSAEIRLNLLLDYPADRKLDVPKFSRIKSFPWELEKLRSLALASSPLTAEINLQILENESRVELSRRNFASDINLRLGYEYKESLTPMYELMAGFELPVHKSRKQEPLLRESETMLKKSRKELDAATNEIEAGLTENFYKLQSGLSIFRLYKEKLLPQARLAAESSSSNYTLGRIDYTALLDDIHEVYAFELSLIREQNQFWNMIAALEEITAASLVKWNDN